MSQRPPSPRERYRVQTAEEAKRIASRQLAEGGPGAISLNAIAKEMGLTGPALYRYFASRDELLAELVTDAYNDLADVFQAAAEQEGAHSPRARLHALAEAYRQWALAQPHRYQLLFASSAGSGQLAPERTIPAAHRTMTFLFDTLVKLLSASPTTIEPQAALDRQLEQWAERRLGPKVQGLVARHGLLFWTRLHGLLSLELLGHFAVMGIDPTLLYAAEVDALIGGEETPRRPKKR
ncbi:TetR/AcrR family transcriptional regulator [Archangium violaceum]|uniref:TetR/AcrR family transcriptional regulator n=1 Tax=Archangium violaceum TaxID=83451 RepID=UPI002B2BB09B|nr:TetR/AcrR family transcriptional regulator [Archangium violaceum]